MSAVWQALNSHYSHAAEVKLLPTAYQVAEKQKRATDCQRYMFLWVSLGRTKEEKLYTHEKAQAFYSASLPAAKASEVFEN